jgi:hypothetical protein
MDAYVVKFTGLRIALGVLLAWLCFQVPKPFDVITLTIVFVIVFGSLWRMRPRRCAYCRSRSTLPMRQDHVVPSVRPAWWDMRIPNPSEFSWVCVEHVMTYTQLPVDDQPKP